MKKLLNSLFILPLITVSGLVNAEPYVSASLGWGFDQKLKSITGDENLNYPGPINRLDGSFFPNTKYSNIKLKDVLQGGVKAGYFFEFASNLGVELEANYFQPNMKAQNVTITGNNYIPGVGFVGIGEAVAADIGTQPQCPDVLPHATCYVSPRNSNAITEHQLSAKVKVLQFNLNALYRYQELENLTPYIGGGPSINIIRITGTGESGHFIDPVDVTGYEVVPAASAPRVHDTSVNLGLNFKVGAEYKLDQDWGLGAEYHYNWIQIGRAHV